MGRKRTYTEVKVIELWEQGYSDQEIAEKLGISVTTVRDKRTRFGCVNGHKITKRYLETTGIGDQWDATCEMVRKAAGWG